MPKITKLFHEKKNVYATASRWCANQCDNLC